MGTAWERFSLKPPSPPPPSLLAAVAATGPFASGRLMTSSGVAGWGGLFPSPPSLLFIPGGGPRPFCGVLTGIISRVGAGLGVWGDSRPTPSWYSICTSSLNIGINIQNCVGALKIYAPALRVYDQYVFISRCSFKKLYWYGRTHIGRVRYAVLHVLHEYTVLVCIVYSSGHTKE